LKNKSPSFQVSLDVEINFISPMKVGQLDAARQGSIVRDDDDVALRRQGL